MNTLDFLNNRSIGKVTNNSRYLFQINSFHRPNLDYLISRLACKEGNVYLSEGESGYVPPFTCKFRRDKNNDLLAVANEDGEVILIDTEGDTIVKSFAAHHNAVYDICWLPDKNNLITVSGDHRACLWDMSACEMICSFQKHTESIKSVDVCPNDNAIFATGSRDGSICVWDTRDRCKECRFRDKPSIQIHSAHNRKPASKLKDKKSYGCNHSMSSVSAVAFQDNFNLVSSGAADGVVKVWDLRKTYISKLGYVPSPRYQMKYVAEKSSGHGCTSLVFNSTFKKLYASSTANKIFMFDCHAYNDATIIYDGFRCDTYFIKLALSTDDLYLACGSSDRKAYVWKTSQPGSPVWEFPGHNSEVTTVAWGSCNVSKFVTCGDDNRVLVWKPISDQDDLQVNFIRNDLVAKSCLMTTEKNDRFTGDSETVNIPSPRTFDSDTHDALSVIKTPVMKSIRSFFKPLFSPALKSPNESSSSSSNVSSNSDAGAPCISPVIALSPSKKVNQTTYSFPETLSINSNSNGKENQANPSSSCGSNEQSKRKSSFLESTPKYRKAVKKGKRSLLNVKKQQNLDGNIKNYFKNTLSPEDS